MATPVVLLIILGVISGSSCNVLPPSFSGIAGEAVTFTSTVPPSEGPFLAVTWSFLSLSGEQSNIITSSTQNITDPKYEGRITFYPNTGSLELRGLTLNDQGEYTLLMIKTNGQQWRGNSELTVHVPVSNVVLTASNTDLVELGQAVLACSASGSLLSFLWLNGSTEVTPGGKVQITDGGRTLTIVELTRYDQGPFRCRASNTISDGTSNPVALTISYGPEDVHLTMSPPKEHHNEGSNITFSCSAVSKPPAEFQWFLNSDQLPDTGPELRLTNIHVTQSGNYNCRAFNSKTMKYQLSQIAPVTVLEPVSSVVVTADATDISEYSGSVRLSCSVSGSSPLSFTWLNGSSVVKVGEGVQLTDGGRTLTIINVTRYDQGPFRCQASNSISNGTSDPVTLTISYGPEDVRLTMSPPKEHHNEGSNITFSCSAVSKPPAEFQWFVNSNQLPDTGPELRLNNIHGNQSGNYSCQAFNSKTMKHQLSHIAPVTVLEKVSSVVITADATDISEYSGSVRLSCSASGSSPLSFSWLNGSSGVTVGEGVQITDDSRIVTVINVTRYDRGPFRCQASNTISNGTSDPVTLIISYGPEDVRLTVSPPKEHHNEDSNVTLSCSAVSRPPAEFQWLLNSNQLPDTGPELRLTNIHVNQSGNYTCRAFNNKTMKHQLSQIAPVTVQEKVSSVVVTADATDILEYSGSVHLSCSASGSSPLSFSWKNGSAEVAAGEGVQLTDGGRILTIINVTRYDRGPFRCQASNSISNGTSDPVTLTISYGPEDVRLTMSPSKEHHKEGSNITFSCSAVSKPPAEFQWFVNSNQLPDTGPELRLTNINMNQSGNYSCQAFNNKTMKSQLSQVALVTVLEPVSRVEVTANATDIPEYSGSVHLSCSASGSSPLFFSWLNGTSEVMGGELVQLTDDSRNLTIINVTRYDWGPFRCRASNTISNGTSDPVNLTISYGPEDIRLTMSPPEEHHKEGSNVTLSCSAVSRPTAEFQWFVNSNQLPDTGPELRLTNIHVNQSGNYNCRAFNSKTMKHQLSQITPVTVLEPVSSIMVTANATDILEYSGSVRLSCSASGSSPLTFSWLNGSSEVMGSGLVQLTDEGRTLTIINVTRYDRGPFRCQASNTISNGTSDPVTLTISYGPEDVHLTVSPPEEHHKEGSNITLSCSAVSKPPAEFQWFLNSNQLPDTGPELRLTNIHVNHSGNYNCRAFNSKTMKHQLSQIAPVTVLEPVSSVVVTTDATDIPEYSGSVSLSCSASGSSPLSFSWLNSSSEVTVGEGVQLTDGGRTLTIINVTRYDRGPFRCHVFNAVSNGTSDPVTLTISYGPEDVHLTMSPPKEHHKEGSNITFSCSAVSKPPAEFQWFLNSNQLPDTGPELRLNNIHVNHSGNYNCRAFNSKTMKHHLSQIAPVSVLEPVSSVEVIANATDILEYSGSVRLSCSVSGSSPLSFSWLNGSSEVTVGEGVQLTDGGRTLTIINVTRYDGGPFRCHVANAVSNSTSDPVSILVIFGPDNIQLQLSPSQEYYDEGADVTLTCSVASIPPAQFQWFVNEKRLPYNGSELRLLNLQVHQSGNYSCLAFNNKTMATQKSQPVPIYVRQTNINNVVLTANTTELSELGSVSLACSTSGSFPSFLWLNRSSELKTSDRVHIEDRNFLSIVTIINVTRYDRGPFVCHAFNNFSNHSSDPLELIINFGPENVLLRLSPLQEYYEKGSNISMSCSAASRPAATFQWFKDGNLLQHVGPELKLTDIKEDHNGSYSCQAFNNKTMIYKSSQPAVIMIMLMVSNVAVTSNATVLSEFSGSVSLSCSSFGTSLYFLWLNGSSEVTAGERVQLTNGGRTLTIINVSRYDPGPFRCNVSSGANHEISQPMYLVIQYGPDNMDILGPESLRVADYAMLHCSAMSVPSATFTWLFNGNTINVHGSVHIIPAVKSSDGGKYTCTAKNAVTGLIQTVHHTLTVSESSVGDCSTVAMNVASITAACCILIVVISAFIAFCLVKWRRVNSIYPAYYKEKPDFDQKQSYVYKTNL